jgi:DNA transformation protein
MKKARSKAAGAAGSLRVSKGFEQFVLDQLAGVGGLRAKSMFGGIGLYADDVFFAIVARDVLYFKVTDANRRQYERAGSVAFKPFAHRPTSMNYFSVPVAILEDPESLRRWAAGAIEAARSKRGSDS